MKQAKTLYLVDISSFIFRAFFAIRKLTTSKGISVNAVFGVTNMLLQLLEKYKPDAIACVFDTPKPSFRKEIYDDYKSNRGAPPDELIPQFDLIKESVEKMGIQCLSMEGFEADDIIASLTYQFEDYEVKIVTGDKDLMQLVNNRVQVIDTMKNISYGPKEVKEKLGVNPENVTDLLALVGDSSDNIPGVNGIGAKGAAELINMFGSVENIFKNIDQLKEGRKKESLISGKKMAILSKKLATVHKDPIQEYKKLKLSDFAPPKNWSDEFIHFIKDMEFKSLVKKLCPSNSDSAYEHVNKNNKLMNQFESLTNNEISLDLIKNLKGNHSVCVCFDSFEHNFIVFTEKYKFQIEPSKNNFEIFLNELISNKIQLIGYNLKHIYKKILYSIGYSEKLNKDLCTINTNSFDLMIAHYVLNPEDKHDKEYIFNKYDCSIDDSYNTYKSIQDILNNELKSQNLESVYFEIEQPVVIALASMEFLGIQVDVNILKNLSVEYETEIKILHKKIIENAGEEFNINSPKQLSHILFEKLKLPVITKTKTGFSTDAEVLSKLSKLHPVPKFIIKFREYSKLKSTYIDALPELTSSDGRIHASFNQAVTATGRLSSSDPNLQNIPIKTEAGRKIRSAFVAKKNHLLVGADYSQIELRVIAHLSEDRRLIEAFNNNIDIHKSTAADIFHIKIDHVTDEQRSAAKAINFGLIYGKTAFGLSQELNISRSEAQNYIDAYFKKYSQVKLFLDSAIEFAKKNNYAQTMFGRKRIIKDILNKNMGVRNFAERMAMNTPVQGTAADIIKIAMIKVDQKCYNMNAKLILQVHDELILETNIQEKVEAELMLKSEMENAVKLKVPLTVNINSSSNWYDL